jgi:dolichyl-phosphate beta-glucosyltransferase
LPSAVRLVVPCFDEAHRLDVAAFRAGLAAAPGLAFTFVDDGSTDGTRALLEPLAREAPDRVEIVALPVNVGKGEAVRAGVRAALGHAPDFVGWWDADLATPLDEVARLEAALAARPTAWMAMGARVQRLGSEIRRRALRHYAGRFVATCISRGLGLRAYDTQCGAKLFRATATPAGLFDAPFVTRWLFDVEVLARLLRRHRDGLGAAVDALVVEVPLLRWSDVPGSKVRPTDFFRALLGVRRIRRHYRLP